MAMMQGEGWVFYRDGVIYQVQSDGSYRREGGEGPAEGTQEGEAPGEGNQKPMKPLLIGLSGHAGAGKSTAAGYLVKYHNYRAFAFSDALKRVVSAAFGFSPEQLYGGLKEVSDPRFGKSPRWCMQYLGTDVLRTIWPEIWIWHLRQYIGDCRALFKEKPIVVTDVRFLDEAQALKDMGAVLWRIERADVGIIDGIPGHVSECELDNYGATVGWDMVIGNNRSLPKLFAALDRAISG